MCLINAEAELECTFLVMRNKNNFYNLRFDQMVIKMTGSSQKKRKE